MAELYTFSEEGMRKLVEAYRAQQREMSNLKRHLAHYSTRRHEAVYLPATAVSVRNDSGEEIPAHGVMRVTSVDLEPDVYVVAKPNTEFKCRYLVNNSTAIPIDGTGKGTWLERSGVVLYNDSSGTPAIDEEWGAKSGQWSLEKNRPGFLITGGTDTTDHLTRAKQHIVTSLKGKPDSTISLNAAGTVSIWMGASGSEAVTEYDITCRAWGAAVTSAKKVIVWFESGVWYVAPWECS
jgi:hypothetical protein